MQEITYKPRKGLIKEILTNQKKEWKVTIREEKPKLYFVHGFNRKTCEVAWFETKKAIITRYNKTTTIL